MDELTAIEMADVQHRWGESGNPALGGMGASDEIVQETPPEWGTLFEKARKELEKLFNKDTGLDSASEEKAKDKKKKDAAAWATKKLDCEHQGGLWITAQKACARKYGPRPSFFSVQNAPWIAVGVAGVLLIGALVMRRRR